MNKEELLLTMLTVLFVGLKLTGVITWGWLVVASPFLSLQLIEIIGLLYAMRSETRRLGEPWGR